MNVEVGGVLLMNIIEALEKEQLKSDIPQFAPGDTVKVHAKIVEGSRERIQIFEGVVIGRQGTGVREMFTVRTPLRPSSPKACPNCSCDGSSEQFRSSLIE